MQRFYYSETCSKFLTQSEEFILGVLGKSNEYELTLEQRGAWLGEISIMKRVLRSINKDGQVVFEYTIPRLGKRPRGILFKRWC